MLVFHYLIFIDTNKMAFDVNINFIVFHLYFFIIIDVCRMNNHIYVYSVAFLIGEGLHLPYVLFAAII